MRAPGSSVVAPGICGFAALVVGGLAVAMLSRPVAGSGGVCSRDWSASINPCSGARSCGSAVGLATLDSTARGRASWAVRLLEGQESLSPPYCQGAPGWLGWLDYWQIDSPGPLLEAGPQRLLADSLPIYCVSSPLLGGSLWRARFGRSHKGAATRVTTIALFYCTGKGAMCAERHKSP